MMAKNNSRKIFEVFNNAFMVFMIVITLYPLIYVVLASVSDSNELIRAGGKLLYKPLGFNFDAYKKALSYPMILTGYKNTIFVVIVGTILSMVLSSVAAYFMTRKDVLFKKTIVFLMMFTMYFSGGLIPFYFVVNDLGLIDTIWALIIPSCLSTYNIIVLRTGFAGVPESLVESARIDGAGHMRILFSVIIPLAKASLAVVALYYGVSYWNGWFNASIFLQKSSEHWPLQLVLRKILILNDTSTMTAGVDMGDVENVAESIKYAVIILATVPILVLYPFIQKYFVKGVMVGAVKG